MANLCVAMSGHRPKDIDGDYTMQSPIWKWIGEEIIDLFEKVQPPRIISGMALGIDTLSIEIALKLKIPFVAAVPFEGQEKLWPENSQRRYNELLELAEEVIFVSPGRYANWKFQKRNEWMVDRADIVCAVWRGSAGGTANCVKYAVDKSVPVWIIDPRMKMSGRYNGIEIIPKPELVVPEVRSGEKVS